MVVLEGAKFAIRGKSLCYVSVITCRIYIEIFCGLVAGQKKPGTSENFA